MVGAVTGGAGVTGHAAGSTARASPEEVTDPVWLFGVGVVVAVAFNDPDGGEVFEGESGDLVVQVGGFGDSSGAECFAVGVGGCQCFEDGMPCGGHGVECYPSGEECGVVFG